ncbi:hypothetical protein MJG53_004758 [Ovis ammon polii x Ovis aries]|uniref:Uncharacterized protein n=1 Tax=Ovis ammon polii x Ovis aries TaxID=2918886 RepID=A0ACB9VBX3_9CETA|nr:hypothetical protein MJG53_004758 [Ovis ammon polii x Ovis aries]
MVAVGLCHFVVPIRASPGTVDLTGSRSLLSPRGWDGAQPLHGPSFSQGSLSHSAQVSRPGFHHDQHSSEVLTTGLPWTGNKAETRIPGSGVYSKPSQKCCKIQNRRSPCEEKMSWVILGYI